MKFIVQLRLFRICLLYHLFLVSITTLGATNKYRLTLRDNPSTSIVIGWVQVSGNAAAVYYGPVDYGINYTLYPNVKQIDKTVTYKGMNNNFARISGLKPNTAYYFVIKDSQGASSRYWFKTAPADTNERLSIIAGGDSRNNQTPRRNANKLVAKLRPHAVLFGGDMTSGGSNEEWATWFDDWQLTIGTDGRMIPVIAARGNHESSNLDIVNLFDVPSNDVYYGLTFGGSLIRAYTLNSEAPVAGSQTNWLSSDLIAHTNVIWKCAHYHRPMRPHVSSKPEMETIKTYWEPLFYQHGVKLVVECDAHVVKSTYPIRSSTEAGNDEGFIRDDEKGVVYVGEGGWGAPLRSSNDNKNWTRNSGAFNQFNLIFVDKGKMEVRFIKVDNADNVGTVNDSDIFQLPSNLDVWAPSNGNVITIHRNNTTTTPPPTGEDKTITASITTGNDDIEERTNGFMDMNSSDLELVFDNSTTGNQTIGLRFNNLTIPKGALIKSAFIQFTTDEVSTLANPALTIKAEASDNAAAFTTVNFNASSRPRTTEFADWSPGSWTSVNQAAALQKTPDIKTVIQEVVSRSGWNSSNSLVIIITGTGKRTARAFEASSSQAAKLSIVYSTDLTPGVLPLEALLEATEELNLKVYPNPSEGLLNVELSKLYYEKADIELAEIKSSKTYKPQILNTDYRKYELNTNGIAPGYYIIKLKVGGKLVTSRVLIKY